MIVAVLVFGTLTAGAQTIPVNTRFGAVSDSELEMTVYPPDTSAAVLVLYRKSVTDATVTSSLTFMRRTVHTERIKILKESGRDYADYKIFYATDSDPREQVKDIKVVTYNLENGKRTVDKLPHKLIFDEEVSDRRRSVSFSAQNVRVGSVVEVSFTLDSPYVADIGTVYLQSTVPINISEAVVSYAEYFHFNRMMRGSVPCQAETSSNPETVMIGGSTLSFANMTDSYRAVDVPAYKAASHCYCPDLYRFGYTYDLRYIDIDNVYHQDYSTSWGKVDELFRTEGRLKDFYAKSRFTDEAARAKADTVDEAAQVAAIRNAVVDKVRWNDRISSHASAAKAFKKQEGDSADINALVAAALNGAGFTADPVFLRTRSKGRIMDFHVSADAYNAVVLRVTSPSGQTWMMDASDDCGYLNVLPEDYLVEQARVIPLKGDAGWVNLSGLCRNQLSDTVAMEVAADGSITGTCSLRGYNNWASDMKDEYDGYDKPDDYAAAIENEDGIEVDGLEFVGNGEWSPDASVSFSFSGEATVSGEHIYIRPFLTRYHSEGDFRDPERQIPVEFPFAETINYSARITIPEGYTVESLPQATMLNGGFMGSRTVVQCVYDGGRTVSVNFRYNRGLSIVSPEQYGALRDFWAHLCSTYDSTIVLRKI